MHPPALAGQCTQAPRPRPGATEPFTAQAVAQQQGRDLIKQGLCILLGIKLVIVKEEDLTLDRMRQKIGVLLLMRDLAGRERVVRLLEEESPGVPGVGPSQPARRKAGHYLGNAVWWEACHNLRPGPVPLPAKRYGAFYRAGARRTARARQEQGPVQ